MGRHATTLTGLTPAAAERRELCALLLEVGEDAPTLCKGWDTSDLAAHLVTRENRVDAVLGLVIPPLRSYTAHLEQATHDATPYPELVAKLRSGPPLRTPLGLPLVKDRANLHEFFIHHEDVRRAQPGWTARELPASESAQLWNLVRLMAPMLLTSVKSTRVTLATPNGAQRSLGRADAQHQVSVTGEPGELLLYLSGRRGVAEVVMSGSVSGQARLAAAPLGM